VAPAVGAIRFAIAPYALVAEKGARAIVAALGDMVRNAGDDDPGEAGHAA
jgi:hypothetical protein